MPSPKKLAAPSITIDKSKKEIVIRLPLLEPKPSSTGKTLIIGTTQGVIPGNVEFDGFPVKLGANVFIPRQAEGG